MSKLTLRLVATAAVAVFLTQGPSATAVGSGIQNGDFESGTVGDTTVSGWTAVNERIDLGVTSIASCLTQDTSNYTTLRNWDSEYDDSYGGWDVGVDGPVPVDPDPSVNNDSLDLESQMPLDEPSEFTTNLVDGATIAIDLQRTSKVVELFSSINTDDLGGYVVHGPALYSEAFSASTIDDLTIDWAASDEADDYHVFGYLLNTSNCTQTEVIDSTGEVSPWQTSSVAIPADGNYRFVFVAGTFDATFGTVGGAYLYLDNIILTVNEQRQAEEEARLAQTGDDSATILGSAATFSLVIGAALLALRRRIFKI
jgi:LPXTG-motif cell wall-anchored protein